MGDHRQTSLPAIKRTQANQSTPIPRNHQKKSNKKRHRFCDNLRGATGVNQFAKIRSILEVKFGDNL